LLLQQIHPGWEAPQKPPQQKVPCPQQVSPQATQDGGQAQAPFRHVFLPGPLPPVQTLPHAPQLELSLARLTHVPPQQASPPAQAAPQLPQLEASVCKSTHCAPKPGTLQQVWVGSQQTPLQLQRPSLQHCPAGQHDMGCLAALLQAYVPSGQHIPSWQEVPLGQHSLPRQQDPPAGQALPQDPQFVLSWRVLQLPLQQTEPEAQTFPQLPQLDGSD
jgi:hypothetical protein